MCLACQESDYFFRLYIADKVARGEMPTGMTEDDLRELGIALPGAFAASGAFTVEDGARSAEASDAAVPAEGRAGGEGAGRE